MADRFELEQNIMSVWNTKEDIDLLMDNVLNKEMSKDEISNALLGISSMHQMRSEKLFDGFTQMVMEKQFVKENGDTDADIRDINLNNQISFVLTSFGREKLGEYYTKYEYPDVDITGVVVMSLWEFMQIFGGFMHLGMTEVITEKNSIKILEE